MREITECDVKEAFEKAKRWIKQNFPMFYNYAEEPELEFVKVKEGWDLRVSVKERKIKVNMEQIRWYLWRETQIKCPQYDIETALIHDLFEYCYFRLWNYPEDDQAIIGLVHAKARILENALRKQRGLTPWY